MKAILCLILLATLAGSSAAQPFRFEKAVEYNDFIVGEQTKIGQTIKDFLAAYNQSKDSAQIQEARKNIVKQADSSVARLKRLVSYKGDTAFKMGASRLFGFYSTTARIQYDQLIKLSYNTTLDGDALQKQFSALIADISGREKIFDTYFLEAQKAFAAKYNFTLAENTFKVDQ